jgi:hypothetical protein
VITMTGAKVPLAVLAAALVALVASIGWAATRGGDDGGWMMSSYGPGMMGYASPRGGEPVESVAEARDQAKRFAERLGLEVGEVMRFSNHFYAELVEDGAPATEVLVQPATGAVHLEYGPAMMWNTRYGMMSDFRLHQPGGMMGGMVGGMMGDVSGAAPVAPRERDVTPAEARELAERWLQARDRTLAAGDPERFPGYYTLHVLRDGEVAGMLSVNESTGAVWYHAWHGRYVELQE